MVTTISATFHKSLQAFSELLRLSPGDDRLLQLDFKIRNSSVSTHFTDLLLRTFRRDVGVGFTLAENIWCEDGRLILRLCRLDN